MNILPKQEDIDSVKNSVNEVYVCMNSECMKQIKSSEVLYETMPGNFIVGGLEDGSGIPQCPHCKYLHFFGMKSIEA